MQNQNTKRLSQINEPRDELVKNLIFFLMCFLALFGSFFITAQPQHNSIVNIGKLSFELRGVCFFKLLTGYNCPVCGMTRCFALLSHGNLKEAIYFSHSGISVYSLCVFETFYRLLRIFFGYRIRLKSLQVIEIILIITTCFAVSFFFIAQFFDHSLII